MTQRGISITTQGRESIIIEFQELYRHAFNSVYTLTADKSELNLPAINGLMMQWIEGEDIEYPGLMVA